jgi:hypothetical protein
MEPRLKLSK